MNKNQWLDTSVKRLVFSQLCFVFFWLINCFLYWRKQYTKKLKFSLKQWFSDAGVHESGL